MAELPYLEPERLSFSSFDDKTIREISVKCITNPTSVDRIGTPLPGGLYDPALGPNEQNEVCITCNQYSTNCPGHFGHIQLPLPVFNPIYFSYLVAILRSCCFACNRLLCSDYQTHVLALQLRAVRAGYVACAQSMSEIAQSIVNRAKGAKESDPKVQKGKGSEEVAVEVTENLVDEIKASTEALFKATVLSTADKTTNISSANEYLMDLLVSYLKAMSSHKTCPHCQAPVRDVVTEGNTKIYLKPLAGKKCNSWDVALKKQPIPDKTKASPPWHRVSKIVLLTPNAALSLLSAVHSADTSVYNLLFNGTAPSSFFYRLLAVPPVKFRPMSVVSGLKYEHFYSAKLSEILSLVVQLSTLLAEQKAAAAAESSGDSAAEEKYKQIQGVWVRMQGKVNEAVTKVRSVLEKKQGLFRMHMMGKRVNYAARSVISPDPYIDCDEVGIPLVFASRLTYPQPVTPWNVVELRQAVMNGPLKYPGATHVEMEDGKRVLLSPVNPRAREAIAKTLLLEDKNRPGYNKKVCRHVRNGDVLLLNRQPTLHKVSIMAHRARVLTNERTLRLHYSVCKSYNADFDGDEMNAHLPQDEVSRSEAYSLMSVSDNYLVPKDGKPLGGLIQDHIVAGTLLTQRGRFFSRDEYHHFVFMSLVDTPRRIRLLPPSVLKPRKLWSGKQIITTILRAVIPPDRRLPSLTGKSATPEKCWITSTDRNPAAETDDLLDSEVIIREGELLCGVMDKGQCGTKEFGLVHCVFELYGGEVATRLLSALGRLFTSFLAWRGFTVGLKDILVRTHGDEERREIMAFQESKGEEIACKVLGVERPCDLKEAYRQAHLKPVPFKDLGAIDRGARAETARIETELANACMGINLLTHFPHNNLQLMVRTGAKGSDVNCSQISCMVGQTELEGARPPLMLSGRSLPSYLPYEPSLAAGGLIMSRFLTGIKPQEMFFNCMAGREGLVDTAVKTSRSGYLQRCLIKHLEGICTSYDHTARDSDGSVVQFLYGGDGIDVTKANFLLPTGMKHLTTNSYVLVGSGSDAQKEQLECEQAGKMVAEQEAITRYRKRYVGPFQLFEKKMRKKEKYKNLSNDVKEKQRSEQTLAIIGAWNALKSSKKELWEAKAGRRRPLPVLSSLPPHRHFGAVSEQLRTNLTSALVKCSEREELEETILLHSIRALSHPGDGVGVLAGQSIGEPSTQMTLNTFHFAGRADMNITMGIPRLREILMTGGSNMKTPMMTVPLRLGTSPGAAKFLAKRLTEVRLSQVLERVDIVESLTDERGVISHRFKITFHILPEKYYEDKCYCTPVDVLNFIENTFIGKLQAEFVKQRNNQVVKAVVQKESPRDKARGAEEEAEGEGGEQDDDEREEGARRDAQKDQINSYEDDQEEEGEELGAQPTVTATTAEPQEEAQEVQEAAEAKDEREQALLRRKSITAYRYDKANLHWCEVVLDFALSGSNIMMSSVVEDLAKRSLLWNVQGIKRAFINTEKDERGRQVLITEGINIREIWEHHELVDTQDIYTNDINMFCDFYGIEAASAALTKEIQGVFAPYGIRVDPRHLSLLSDYVTQHGVYRPFNRIGIRDSSSPLQKVSFETSTEFLRRAAFYNEQDTLDNPSSSIVLGKLGTYGTGICEIRQPISI